MYFFKINKKEKLSPPSLISLYAIYSTNRSYIFIPTGRLFWNENKMRATIATGTIRANNDFDYGENEDEFRLVFSEIRNFVSIDVSRRVVGHFYIGVMYLGTKTSYKFDQGSQDENDFAREFFKQKGIKDNFVSSIGLDFSLGDSGSC